MAFFLRETVHTAHLGTFLRFMGFAIRRGTPAVEFIDRFLGTHEAPGYLRDALSRVKERVSEGESLSQAMGRESDVFPEWLVGAFRAGERGGNLEVVATRLAALQTERYHFQTAVEHDWAYPVFLMGVISLILLALGLFALPDIFANSLDLLESDPGYRKRFPILGMIIQGTGSLGPWSFRVFGVIAFAVSLFLLYVVQGNTFGRGRLSAIFGRLGRLIPFYGKAQESLALSGLCDIMSGLLNQGVPLHEALRLASTSLAEGTLNEHINRFAERVEAGAPFDEALEVGPGLPHMFLFRIRLGSQENLLARSFAELATHYREKAEMIVERAHILVQPVVICGVGAVVAVLWFLVFYVLFGMLGMIEET